MKRPNVVSAIVAGVVGTVVMTLVMVMAPMMGMPKMDIAGMLAGFMGISILLGWIAHFMIGIILAFGYALLFAGKSRLKPWLLGAIYGLIPWLMAQLLVMPMMGVPIFSGSAVMAMGSLIGHLIYGAVIGAVYRPLPAAGE